MPLFHAAFLSALDLRIYHHWQTAKRRHHLERHQQNHLQTNKLYQHKRQHYNEPIDIPPSNEDEPFQTIFPFPLITPLRLNLE